MIVYDIPFATVVSMCATHGQADNSGSDHTHMEEGRVNL